MKRFFQKLCGMLGFKPKQRVAAVQSELAFDKSVVFKEEIQPFLDRASELCTRYEIPFLFWTVTRCKEAEDGKPIRSGYVRMRANHPYAWEVAVFGNVASGDLSLHKMAKYVMEKIPNM